MTADQELIDAADRNFVGSYRKLVDHCPGGSARELGAVFAFVTGLPIGIFNGCIVAAPAATHDLDKALAWIRGFDVPHRLWIHEELADRLAPDALQRGMEQEVWATPEMVLGPGSDPPPPPPGVTVEAVTDGRSLDDCRGVFVAGGMSEDVAGRLIASSFAADPDVRCLIARLDGRPVGTSIALRTGDVSGVYAVGTLPDARRRGVGTAATLAAVAAGRAWGCDTIVLQSSEMGFPMYQEMGFRTVVRYATFRPSR